MKILELLKQLKKEIKPDPNYVLNSRNQLLNELNSPIFGFKTKIKILQTIYSFVYSFVLTFGVLVFIISGFVLFKNIIPKFSVLNPEAIKAEADAIDFQIQLSKIIYNTPEKSSLILNSALNKNLNQNLIVSKNQKEIIFNSSTISSSTSSSSPESLNQNSSTAISIDEVLDYLSK